MLPFTYSKFILFILGASFIIQVHSQDIFYEPDDDRGIYNSGCVCTNVQSCRFSMPISDWSSLVQSGRIRHCGYRRVCCPRSIDAARPTPRTPIADPIIPRNSRQPFIPPATRPPVTPEVTTFDVTPTFSSTSGTIAVTAYPAASSSSDRRGIFFEPDDDRGMDYSGCTCTNVKRCRSSMSIPDWNRVAQSGRIAHCGYRRVCCPRRTDAPRQTPSTPITDPLIPQDDRQSFMRPVPRPPVIPEATRFDGTPFFLPSFGPRAITTNSDISSFLNMRGPVST